MKLFLEELERRESPADMAFSLPVFIAQAQALVALDQQVVAAVQSTLGPRGNTIQGALTGMLADIALMDIVNQQFNTIIMTLSAALPPGV